MNNRFNNPNWYNFQQPMQSFPTGNRGYNRGHHEGPPPLMSNIIIPDFLINNGFLDRNGQVKNRNGRNFNSPRRNPVPSNQYNEGKRRGKKRRRRTYPNSETPSKRAKEQTNFDVISLLSDEESTDTDQEPECWLNNMPIPTNNIDLNNRFADFLKNLIKNVEEPYLSNIKKIDLLIQSLRRTLNNRNVQYTFVPFGSCITGLAFHTSDIDLCIQRDGMDEEPFRLKALSRKLSNNRQTFSKVIHIKAKVPIVRFMHLPTNKYCDISTEKGSQENTKLVQYFLSYDSRIKPLMMYLKYWFKSHSIHGTGKFTTYNLVWIVVFYLQQLNPPLLPTVYQLQNAAHENIINGWNCGFDESFNANLPQNDIGLFDMVVGFFRYYCNFNFRKNVICPYVGYPMSVSGINDHRTLPESYNYYSTRLQSNDLVNTFKDHVICVQDPFQHNSNVAKQVAYPIFENFRNYCYAVVGLVSSGCEDFDRFIINGNSRRKMNIMFNDSKASITFKSKQLPTFGENMILADKYRSIIKAVCYIIKHIVLAIEPLDGYTTFIHRTDDLILPIQFTISFNNKVLKDRNEITKKVIGHKLTKSLDNEIKMSAICVSRLDASVEPAEATFSFDVTEETDSITLSVEGDSEICHFIQIRGDSLVRDALCRLHTNN